MASDISESVIKSARMQVQRVEEARNAAVDAESARLYGAEEHARELEAHYEALRRAQELKVDIAQVRWQQHTADISTGHLPAEVLPKQFADMVWLGLLSPERCIVLGNFHCANPRLNQQCL